MTTALIIDGDADARHGLADKLREDGILADLVADAREAIEWLRAAANRYDFVLIDVSAATPGSMALLTWLRTKHPLLAVIVLNRPSGIVSFSAFRLFGSSVPVWQKPLSSSDVHEIKAWTREHFRRGVVAELDTSSPQAA